MKRSAPLVLLLSATLLASQEQITPPENKYTPGQDIELGLKAAAEVRQQMPLMRDDLMSSYVEELGRRLTSAIRPDLRHSEFRYSFEVVNVREINAFALPGGPMFVNRGMIEAAKTEGEVAGVMAHELSPRRAAAWHGPGSKATKYEVGQVAGAVLGAIIGGGWGQVISQGRSSVSARRSCASRANSSVRPTLRCAHHGARRLRSARHGKHVQDDREAGRVWWPTVAERSPEPGDRYDYITREAQLLRVDNPIPRHADLRSGEGAPPAVAACADDRAGDEEPHRPYDWHVGTQHRGADGPRGPAVVQFPDL
jgi:hypothetical protein